MLVNMVVLNGSPKSTALGDKYEVLGRT
jgi:hypothetical protein